MNIAGATVLLTGACGGIGRATARELVRHGAAVIVSGRNALLLDALAKELSGAGGKVLALPADIASADACRRLASDAMTLTGRLDAMIHCAGVQSFSAFVDENEAQADAVFAVNAVAPMRLTRAVLPHFLQKGKGRLLLVGSIFGSIGFPFFVSYSASKFALRGFAESLRRELASTGIGVTYVAPRFTKTAFNRGAIVRMARALGMRQDEPETVAARVIRALRRNGHSHYLGWPERLFVRINSLLPRLVDGPLIRQADKMRPFADERVPHSQEVSA